MQRNRGILLGLLLAASGYAAEPGIVEQTRPDGLTELRIVADAGQAIGTYRVDLQHHHAPATNDAGPIRRWEQYRFGGFVCFNDNQFVGQEFSRNRDPRLYHPAQLDVAGWAAAMRAAGMQYAVLTTRHTSGFLLWDSATTEFDVAASPVPTDVVGAFVQECRRHDIAPGLYYCLWGGHDWMPHPNARAIILAQLHELATRYGEIPYFWIDMKCWGPANLSAQEIYDALKNAQPQAVVIFNQHIQDGTALRYFPTDVLNGEVVPPPAGGHWPFRKVNGRRYYLPFEFEPVSQRIGRGTVTPLGPVGAWFTFGAGKDFQASAPLPVPVLCDWIQQAYARGARNVLLSLAPDYTGAMRPGDRQQLQELGARLRAEGLLAPPAAAAAAPLASLTLDRPARASGVWGHDVALYGPAAACDGDPTTRWGGPAGSRAGWLEVDLGAPTAVARAVILEGWDRTRAFAIQYRAGAEWKDAAAGTTLGARRELKFTPVTAQVFRLNITDATDVPTIWEFQLYPPPQQEKTK